MKRLLFLICAALSLSIFSQALAQNSQCRSTLAYLEPLLPVSRSVALNQQRSQILQMDLRDDIAEYRRNASLSAMADLADKQAQAYRDNLPPLEKTIRTVSTFGGEETVSALRAGDFSAVGGSGDVLAAAISEYANLYYGIIVNTESAKQFRCFVGQLETGTRAGAGGSTSNSGEVTQGKGSAHQAPPSRTALVETIPITLETVNNSLVRSRPSTYTSKACDGMPAARVDIQNASLIVYNVMDNCQVYRSSGALSDITVDRNLASSSAGFITLKCSGANAKCIISTEGQPESSTLIRTASEGTERAKQQDEIQALIDTVKLHSNVLLSQQKTPNLNRADIPARTLVNTGSVSGDQRAEAVAFMQNAILNKAGSRCPDSKREQSHWYLETANHAVSADGVLHYVELLWDSGYRGGPYKQKGFLRTYDIDLSKMAIESISVQTFPELCGVVVKASSSNGVAMVRVRTQYREAKIKNINVGLLATEARKPCTSGEKTCSDKTDNLDVFEVYFSNNPDFAPRFARALKDVAMASGARASRY